MLDETDLEILRRCLPGSQQFNLYTESEEEAETWNEWGDRLLALRDRGFLDIPDGLISYNYQGGVCRYHRIGVRRVTAAGREELRHEPPEPAVIEVIRAKVEHEIRDRHRVFSRRYRELATEATKSGGFHSSRMMLLVDELLREEYRSRGTVLIDAWRSVLAAQNIILTQRVAQLMNQELNDVLDFHSADIRDVFLGSPTSRNSPRTEDELFNMRENARGAIEAQINYAALTPATPPSPAQPTGGHTTHQTIYNLSGSNNRVNIGSEDSSTNVVVEITPPELFRDLRAAFEAQVTDAVERQRVLDRLNALEQSQGTASFRDRYVQFMAIAADHMTVLAPFIPPLAQLAFHG